MTAHTSPPVALHAASTRIPEAVATVKMTLPGDQNTSAPHQLLLQPGQPGAIALQLKNQSDRPWRWRLELKGDFPAHWCSWQIDNAILSPQQSLEQAITFVVPADLFEQHPAVQAHSASQSQQHPPLPLKLNYQTEILVFLEPVHQDTDSSAPQLIGYQVFTLHVRPSSPYLNFLPALYRENDFVSRFLAIIEQAFDPSVQTIDQLWAYLDPLTAPEALLPFLAHWVGWTSDIHWTTQKQRHLLRHAVTLYRWHGTRRGLRFYLHLYTGLPLDDHIPQEAEKHISIEEVFNDGFVVGHTALGRTTMLGGGKPYHFIVRLRFDPAAAARVPMPVDEALIHQIINQQKPAFCTYDLHIVTQA